MNIVDYRLQIIIEIHEKQFHIKYARNSSSDISTVICIL